MTGHVYLQLAISEKFHLWWKQAGVRNYVCCKKRKMMIKKFNGNSEELKYQILLKSTSFHSFQFIFDCSKNTKTQTKNQLNMDNWKKLILSNNQNFWLISLHWLVEPDKFCQWANLPVEDKFTHTASRIPILTSRTELGNILSHII